MGCGRGAVLMLAARRVPGGRAVGADVRRRRDQSGNSRAAAERNAVAEGVRDQVELADADARDLPFAPASFDVVVSSLAISNIRDAGGRAQALREAARLTPARRGYLQTRPPICILFDACRCGNCGELKDILRRSACGSLVPFSGL